MIEAIGLHKSSPRTVVYTPSVLGSVGYTGRIFPAVTLGPGTTGGSIASDNISQIHLLNSTRLTFEKDPVNPSGNVKHGLARRRCGHLISTAAGQSRKSTVWA